MTEDPIKEDPVAKFRKLIASFIPLSRLPKKSAKQTQEVRMDEGKDSPPRRTLKSDMLGSLPRKADLEPGKVDSSPPSRGSKPEPAFDSASQAGYSPWAARLWTTASVISLTINILMTIILLVLIVSVYRLKLDVTRIMELGPTLTDLPRGLYTNFELMERASIQTDVQVSTSIPVKFDLQLNQATNVVLSQDVTITNALVTVNTGGLNITRANTTIVLPQGTILPVNLSLTVPVDQQVPVTLIVPVNIALKDTQLNDPFVGLQDAIEPLYCFLEPAAVDLDGLAVCSE